MESTPVQDILNALQKLPAEGGQAIDTKSFGPKIDALISQTSFEENAYMFLADKLVGDLLDGRIDSIFRTVPGVMDQAIIFEDDHVEIRLHVYSDKSSETYIHNHKHPFISICLDGGYLEKLWGRKDSSNDRFYVFPRQEGGKLGEPEEQVGKLEIVAKRQHYPGNRLFVTSNQFHTIDVGGLQKPPVTFIIKTKVHNGATGHVYSPSRIIQQPTEPIRGSNTREKKYLLGRMEAWRDARKTISTILPL